ncbi:MAG: Ig-like domain-containing protein [Pseudomonadota bacterium]
MSQFSLRSTEPFPENSDEIEEAERIVESLSEYEQARLKAYLATGLYDKFYSQAAKSVAIAMRRSAIQDQVMVHSEYYCRFYKAQLHDLNISVNLAAGLTSGLLGGLATIFTDPTTVRSLAGSAAIVAAGRSEFNETMFSNLAIQTVIAGIDVARENVLRDINKKRFYPLNKDDIDELKSLPDEGVINPGMFNTYGLRASIAWEDLYDREDGQVTYAGRPVGQARDKIGNLMYEPPIFTFSDLLDRTSEEAAAQAAAGDGKMIAINDKVETKEDQPIAEIDVLANDLNADGATLTVDSTAYGTSEVVEVGEDDEKRTVVKYTPRANFHGQDVIRYTITKDVGEDGAKKTVEANAIVDVTVIADASEPPSKKYLALSSVGVYTLEAALQDALRFQTQCSLASGLTAATESLKRVNAPTVDTLTDSIEQMRKMIDATEQLRQAIDKAAGVDDAQTPAQNGAGE